MRRLLQSVQCDIWMPPRRSKDQDAQSAAETDETRLVAKYRIHIERVMARIKQWGFLSRVIPNNQLDIVGKAFSVAAMMANCMVPLTSKQEGAGSYSQRHRAKANVPVSVTKLNKQYAAQLGAHAVPWDPGMSAEALLPLGKAPAAEL